MQHVSVSVGLFVRHQRVVVVTQRFLPRISSTLPEDLLYPPNICQTPHYVRHTAKQTGHVHCTRVNI